MALGQLRDGHDLPSASLERSRCSGRFPHNIHRLVKMKFLPLAAYLLASSAVLAAGNDGHDAAGLGTESIQASPARSLEPSSAKSIDAVIEQKEALRDDSIPEVSLCALSCAHCHCRAQRVLTCAHFHFYSWKELIPTSTTTTKTNGCSARIAMATRRASFVTSVPMSTGKFVLYLAW